MIRLFLSLIMINLMCLSGCKYGNVDSSIPENITLPTPGSPDTSHPEASPAPSAIPTPETPTPETPTPSPIETPDIPQTTFFTDFENGWGIFLDGGLFATLSSENIYDGEKSVKLFGNSGVISSIVQRDPMNLSKAKSLNIQFWMYGEELTDGDALIVDFSDGTQWQTLTRQIQGDDFVNGIFHHVNLDISNEDYTFSQVARVRFTSATAINPVYIDNISITVTGDMTTEDAPIIDNGYVFDHIGVESGCIGCHDNRIAQGKSASHITASDDCQFCHLANNEDNWQSLTYTSGTFDHTNIYSNCYDCHNHILAASKGPNHIDSSNNCEQCHSTAIGGWKIFSSTENF